MPGGHYKDRNRYFNQKTKTAHVRETTRSRPRPSPVDSGGRRANSTPNDGPHLELGRLRLKTWSKSDFSIAQTTGQHISTCVYHRCCLSTCRQDWDQKRPSNAWKQPCWPTDSPTHAGITLCSHLIHHLPASTSPPWETGTRRDGTSSDESFKRLEKTSMYTRDHGELCWYSVVVLRWLQARVAIGVQLVVALFTHYA